MEYSKLKNADYLSGFKPLNMSPIELKFNSDLELKSYYVIISRNNYPYPFYIKIDKDATEISEIYPYLLKDSYKESLKIVKNNIPTVCNMNPPPLYFSHDFRTNKDMTYKVLNNYIFLYDGATCVRKYANSVDLAELGNIKDDADKKEKIRNFIEDSGCSYYALYLDIDTGEIGDIIIGYSPVCDKYYDIRSELNVF